MAEDVRRDTVERVERAAAEPGCVPDAVAPHRPVVRASAAPTAANSESMRSS
ncbi:hypothetical protein CU044_2541 [Streptomyces sp. L-9-10]|uniref:hypothetical protein n=1 Tax=Streptomyces sp. L-9-10 TaxID=1478131 RepID=UPI0010F037DF|nr:hypothetical protein [Streptomyces sp. L-9-10]RYJ29018.1 hypothetical protein CU044_2541 [Streptomyces sp. L-9-10]